MPRTCSVCRSPKRAQIEELSLAGVPLRNISERTGASVASILRHRDAHLSRALVRAAGAEDDTVAVTHLDQLRELRDEMRRLGRQAEKDGDVRAALVALKQAGDLVESTARLVEAGTAQSARLPDVDPKIVSLLSRLSEDERLEFAVSGRLPLAARKESAAWLAL